MPQYFWGWPPQPQQFWQPAPPVVSQAEQTQPGAQAPNSVAMQGKLYLCECELITQIKLKGHPQKLFHR